MKKAIASVVLAILSIFLVASVASACLVLWYQPAMPKR
ncbi:MAG: cyclic lactone autoinducer peptide [Bacteroidota bacterium]